VDLVEDHKTEPVAHRISFQVRRVVGRNGDRLEALFAAAEAADRPIEFALEFALPLLEQVDRRHDDERRNREPFDRRQRDDGLAAARREFEDAGGRSPDGLGRAAGPAIGLEPCLERRRLIAAQFVRRFESGHGLEVEDAIVDCGVRFRQRCTEGGVLKRRNAEAVSPLVGLEVRDGRPKRRRRDR